MDSQPRRSSRTLLWGVLFGILLAILLVVEHLFAARLARLAGPSALHPGLALLSPAVLFVAGLICFFLAGLLAARRTGVLSSGLAAGLIAGCIAAIVGLILALHTTGAAEQVLRHATVAPRLRAMLQAGIAGSALRAILTAISTALVGTGVGALGGLASRGAAPNAPATPPAPGPLPYSTAGYDPASGYPSPPDPYAAPPFSPHLSGGHLYGSPTPQTYIQGDDNPTVQTLRQE